MNETSLYLILAAILGQGIFLLIALQFLPNRNKRANKILSIILLISNLMLLGRVLVALKEQPETLWRVALLVDGSIFIFGPLLYSYIRRILRDESPVFRLNWIHYIPLSLYAIFYIWSLTHDFKSYLQYYYSGPVKWVYVAVELIGILSVGFYSYCAFSLLQISKQTHQEHYASESGIYRFLQVLLIALGIFLTLWLSSFIGYYVFDFYHSIFNYNIMWLSVGAMMYVIGFYSLTRPEIFRIRQQKEKLTPNNSSRLSKEDIQQLQQQLRIKLDQEQVFLDSNISLITLSRAIGTTTNNLSWLLNNVYRKKFYEFINEYRVTAFLELIAQDKHKTTTLFALAMDVGFNSKSTFNKAFKSIMNQTPSSYIKQLKNP